jgi:hypothetical protein
MDNDVSGQIDATLDSVRRRGLGYLGYLLWIFGVLGLLWTANVALTVLERCAELLRSLRQAIGVRLPVTGPDWWVIGGVGLLVLLGMALAVWAYSVYRAAWARRLAAVWGPTPRSIHTSILGLPAVADDRTAQHKIEYLRALLASPAWAPREPAPIADARLNRDTYRSAANAVLRDIEKDIAHRAVTAGLVIGLNRNALIDSMTIAASAFELQLHVLTRLGKRPSPRTWMILVKRAGASIFLNTYVTREDALYLNLAIRKAALGLEVASDAFQNSLADIDLDEVVGHTSIPGQTELAHAASFGMSVGASGLRYIGNFIEHAANDLLQGVMAAGILYYHGMALAAECLALDEEHRRSPEMTRTISEAMAMACAPAGQLLRDQVRKMRSFLRERRRQIFAVAKENVSGTAGRMRDVAKGFADGATGLFGRTP